MSAMSKSFWRFLVAPFGQNFKGKSFPTQKESTSRFWKRGKSSGPEGRYWNAWHWNIKRNASSWERKECTKVQLVFNSSELSNNKKRQRQGTESKKKTKSWVADWRDENQDFHYSIFTKQTGFLRARSLQNLGNISTPMLQFRLTSRLKFSQGGIFLPSKVLSRCFFSIPQTSLNSSLPFSITP